MKKLTGMKSNFSSLENKKMKNLQAITGGEETNNYSYVLTEKPNCSDKETKKDGKLISTLFVGEC